MSYLVVVLIGMALAQLVSQWYPGSVVKRVFVVHDQHSQLFVVVGHFEDGGKAPTWCEKCSRAAVVGADVDIGTIATIVVGQFLPVRMIALFYLPTFGQVNFASVFVSRANSFDSPAS